MINIPLYSKDLLNKLSEEYKEKCPSFEDTKKEIFYYKGKIDLIKDLINLLKEDEELSIEENIMTKRILK